MNPRQRLQDVLSEAEAEVERIGRYEIIDEVARGATAIVYEAHDPVLDRRVAIKQIVQPLEGGLHEEAQAVARLQHPNIIAIHEVGPDFLVMDLIEGRTLADALAEGALTLPERLEVILVAARAMAYAHRSGIVHRDIKPANILLDVTRRVVITDFGLAKRADSQRVSLSDKIVGTLQYMAPEQLKGAEVTPATDVWALGVILHEVVVGARPYDASAPAALLEQIERTPLRLGRRPLAAVLERALQRRPEQRFPDAGALADELERHLARQPPGARAPIYGRWLPWAAMGLLALALSFWAARKMAPAPPEAAAGPVSNLYQAFAQWSQEEEELSARLGKVPDDLQSRLALARVRIQRGEYGARFGRSPERDMDLATHDLQQILERTAPSDPLQSVSAAWLGRLMALRLSGVQSDLPPREGTPAEFARAADLLRRGIAHADARRYLAMLHVVQAAASERAGGSAREHYAAAEQVASGCDTVACRLYRGHALVGLGRYPEAEAVFDAALAGNRSTAWAWELKGWSRARQGDFVGALDALERSAQLAPNRTTPWLLLAAVHRIKGDRAAETRAVQDLRNHRPELTRVGADVLRFRGDLPAGASIPADD